MAQRLNAINVGYRPLNPADDVAGLAGQRQAVAEFEAKSQDMARRAAEENARASLALRVQQVANQNMQAMVAANNNMAKARMQIDMQQKELAQNAWVNEMRLNQSQQQLDQAAAMMPLERERIALANEAQAIENDFAAEHRQLTNKNLAISNSIKRQEFADMVEANTEAPKVMEEIAKVEAAVRAGTPVDDVPWPQFKSEKNKGDYAAARGRIEETTAAELNELNARGVNARVGKLKSNQQNAFDLGTKYNNGNITEEGELALGRMEKWRDANPTDGEKEKHLKDAKGAQRWGEMVNGSYVIHTEGLAELAATRAVSKVPMYSSNLIEGGKDLPHNQFMAKAYNLIENEYRSEEGGLKGDLKPQQKAEVMSRTLEMFGQNVTGLAGEQLSQATAPLYIFDPVLGYNVSLDDVDINDDLDPSPEEVTSYRNSVMETNETHNRRAHAATLGKNDGKVELNWRKVDGMLDNETNVEYPEGDVFRDKYDSDDWDKSFPANKGSNYAAWGRMGISPEDRNDYVTYALENANIKGLTESGGADPNKVLKKDVFQGMKSYRDWDDIRNNLSAAIGFDQKRARAHQVSKPPNYRGYVETRTDEEIIEQEGDAHWPRQANEIVSSEVHKSKSVIKQLDKPLEEWKEGNVFYIPVVHQVTSDFGTPNTQGSGLFGSNFLGEAHWGEGHVPIYKKSEERKRLKMHRVVLSEDMHDFSKMQKALLQFIKHGPELDKLNSYIGR